MSGNLAEAVSAAFEHSGELEAKYYALQSALTDLLLAFAREIEAGHSTPAQQAAYRKARAALGLT